MPATIDPTAVIIGAANIYYRALAATGAWTSVGATMDDSTVRIGQSWYRPELNGMLGPVQGLDYLTEQLVEAEFSMVEIAGAKLALAIPGATSTVTLNTDATGSPGSTTLASTGIIGETAVYVAAVTNFTAGDYIQINVDGTLAEYRQIDVVGTAGARGTGTGLQFRDPLKKAHNSGVVVVETNGTGETVITGSTVRRMPDSAYNQWAVVGEAPNGYYKLILTSAISTTDSAEITFGDEATGMIRTTIQGRYAGATPNTPPWSLIVP